MILLSCSGCCRKDCITPKAGTHRSSETAAPLKPKYSHRPKRNPHTVRAKFAVYHRTPVARYENREFLGDVQFGVWYIRLRDKRRTQTPFDGVVKVEKIMMDEEIENGIDSDVIDLISANIINERNPTCYGTDRRWANHLYPVFLTESYVKSKYISTEMFLHLF